MPWPASCSASSRIWLVIELTCQTVVIRLPALAGFGTRVHTIPDALATSIAATRSTICSCSSTSTCWPDCWPDGTDRPPHRIGSQMGCPGARWDTETLNGVLVATVRDPSDRPRRQTDSRPQAVKDTSASAGSHPIFTTARRHPQVLTRLIRIRVRASPARRSALGAAPLDRSPALPIAEPGHYSHQRGHVPDTVRPVPVVPEAADGQSAACSDSLRLLYYSPLAAGDLGEEGGRVGQHLVLVELVEDLVPRAWVDLLGHVGVAQQGDPAPAPGHGNQLVLFPVQPQHRASHLVGVDGEFGQELGDSKQRLPLERAMPDQGVLAIGPPDLLILGQHAGVDRDRRDDVHAEQRRDPLQGSDHRAGQDQCGQLARVQLGVAGRDHPAHRMPDHRHRQPGVGRLGLADHGVDVLDQRGEVRDQDPLALGTAVPDVVQAIGAPAGIIQRLGDVLVAAEVLAVAVDQHDPAAYPLDLPAACVDRPRLALEAALGHFSPLCSAVDPCPPPVVSTCWGPCDRTPISIRRGLACSATGIIRVKMPWSKLASSRPASRLSPRNSCRPKVPWGVSSTSTSSPSRYSERRSARTETTLRSTVSWTSSGLTPGRSRWMKNWSPRR